jgi:transposase-like protein
MSDNVRTCPLPADPQSSSSIESIPQLSAIDLLLAGKTDKSIAATLGISPRTLYRWRIQPGPFRDLLEQRRRDLFDSAGDRLRALLSSALDTFDKQLRDPYASTSLRAARALLSLASLARSLHPPDPDPAHHPNQPPPQSHDHKAS